MISMAPGALVFWRFKAEPREFQFGYVIERKGSLVHLGPYNGASEGVWVEEDEVEWRKYE